MYYRNQLEDMNMQIARLEVEKKALEENKHLTLRKLQLRFVVIITGSVVCALY